MSDMRYGRITIMAETLLERLSLDPKTHIVIATQLVGRPGDVEIIVNGPDMPEWEGGNLNTIKRVSSP